MKAVETMEIKAKLFQSLLMITYLLIKWVQLILQQKFQSCDQIFITTGSPKLRSDICFNFKPCILIPDLSSFQEIKVY